MRSASHFRTVTSCAFPKRFDLASPDEPSFEEFSAGEKEDPLSDGYPLQMVSTETRGSHPDASRFATHATRLRSQWPLAARESELALIEEILGGEGNRALYLFGPAGVGKTRLAAEVRTRAEAAGTKTLRVHGSATSSNVPFAAVAHLLQSHIAEAGKPDAGPVALDASNEAALLVQMVLQSVRALDNGRAIVFVDDAHLLDSLSATVVSLLIANRDAKVVATVRAGESLHDALSAGLRSGESTRIDIVELSDEQSDVLINSVLGAPVEPVTLRTFRNRALGNTLYLRELLIGAVESSALRLTDGIWELDGILSPTDRLLDAINARLVGLSATDRYPLEILAIGGAVGLGLVEILAPDADLVRLEERGVIVMQNSDEFSRRRRQEVAFAHPLFGEAVLQRITQLRGRAIRHDLANAIESLGAERSEDSLRIAVLRLEAGGSGDAETLLRGAKLARYPHDFALTARFGRAAFGSEPSAAAGLVLGEALYELGQFEQAGSILEAALESSTDESEIVAIAGQLLTTYFWGLHKDEAAAALVDRLHASLTDLFCIGALLAHQSSLQTFAGSPATGMGLLNFLPVMTEVYSFCRVSTIRSITLTFVGRTEEGRAEAVRAFELHMGFEQPMLLPHPSTHTANEALALFEAGRLEEALTRATIGYEHAVTSQGIVSPVWCQLVAAESCLLLGRAADAKGHFRLALQHAQKERFRGTVALAWAGIALASAHLGDLDMAREAMAKSDAERSRLEVFAATVSVARATIAAFDGSRGTAIDELQKAAELAKAGGNVVGEARVLHELVRSGLALKVVDRIVQLGAESDSALIHARVAHAVASANSDPAALASASEMFAELGACVLAAEASLEASSMYLRNGDARRSTACAVRAETLLSNCDMKPQTYSLSASTLTPLTVREREIAYLAAEGLSSKLIGERLFVSARTVENHLSRVFTKLGVSSRQELEIALLGGTAS
jgi:DNA-binding CsgD family transcriptional regulator/tetratricopeptide (TPR) repeat protein